MVRGGELIGLKMGRLYELMHEEDFFPPFFVIPLYLFLETFGRFGSRQLTIKSCRQLRVVI